MILYTPLPMEDIFPQEANFDKAQYGTYKGCSVCVESMENGAFQIVHLQSTDPVHFLDSIYEPGKIIQAQDICFES